MCRAQRKRPVAWSHREKVGSDRHSESDEASTSVRRIRGQSIALTRPVAPQQASLASSITTLSRLEFPFLRKWAAKEPVIPLPTTTISAVAGSSSVVLWPYSFLDGCLCQYECVDLGVGRPDWPSATARTTMFSGICHEGQG